MVLDKFDSNKLILKREIPDDGWTNVMGYLPLDSYMSLKSTSKSLYNIFQERMPYPHEWVEKQSLRRNSNIIQTLFKKEPYRSNWQIVMKAMTNDPFNIKLKNEFNHFNPDVQSQIVDEAISSFIVKYGPGSQIFSAAKEKEFSLLVPNWKESSVYKDKAYQTSFSYFYRYPKMSEELPLSFQNDFNLLSCSLFTGHKRFKNLPEELQNNRHFVMGWLRESSQEIFGDLPAQLRKNPTICLNALTCPSYWNDSTKYARVAKVIPDIPDSVYMDEQFIKRCDEELGLIPQLYKRFPETVRHRHHYTKKALGGDPKNFEFVHDSLKRDKNAVWEVIQRCGECIRFAHSDIRNDAKFMAGAFESLKTEQLVPFLGYSDESYKNNKILVLDILSKAQKSTDACEIARSQYSEVLIDLCNRHPEAAFCVSKTMCNAKTIAQLLKKQPKCLQFVVDRYKDDKTIVQPLLKRDGLLLQFISNRLKNDPQLVDIAFKQNKNAIQYAGDAYKSSLKMMDSR